jgi:hypothetical protein
MVWLNVSESGGGLHGRTLHGSPHKRTILRWQCCMHCHLYMQAVCCGRLNRILFASAITTATWTVLCLNPSCVLGVVFTHHGSCRQEPVVASLLFGVIGQYSIYAAWALLTLEAYR